MAAPRKPVQVELPASTADEIKKVARRLHRSVTFISLRALKAAPIAEIVPSTGERRSLAPHTDEDDSADTLTKNKRAAGDRCLQDALAAALVATPARFHSWIAREEDAGQAENADDPDQGLKEGRDPATSVERRPSSPRAHTTDGSTADARDSCVVGN